MAVAMGAPLAGELDMESLRESFLRPEALSGQFLQCTAHGKARIAEAGTYAIEPGARVELAFKRPKAYTIVFRSDGSQARFSEDGQEQPLRRSPLAKLIFSIMNLRAEYINKHFDIEISGGLDSFFISLSPKRRMSRLIESVELTGSHGRPSTLRLLGRDKRVISFYMFPAGAPLEHECR